MTDEKDDLRALLTQQDVVPLIERANSDNFGFALRHEYALCIIRVHRGNCFDPEVLNLALDGLCPRRDYTTLTELLAAWRVD